MGKKSLRRLIINEDQIVEAIEHRYPHVEVVRVDFGAISLREQVCDVCFWAGGGGGGFNLIAQAARVGLSYCFCQLESNLSVRAARV